MPSMNSYLLENLILNYYETNESSEYVDVEVAKILAYISHTIYQPVMDPKEIQGDLNQLTTEQRRKISDRALSDFQKASEAIHLEKDGEIESSIKKWGEIFGSNFPKYE